MINNEFWKAAASSWSWEGRPEVKVKTGNGGKISKELLKKPSEAEEGYFVFDDIDFDATFESFLSGGDVVSKEIVKEDEQQKARITIDEEAFETALNMGNLEGYISCFIILRDCGLYEDVTNSIKEVVSRLEVLKEADTKNKAVYEADLSSFLDDYIPDAINITAGLIDFYNHNVNEEMTLCAKKDVISALDTLLIGINDKIDEIYKFASINLRAEAKALNATMNSNGFIDSKYKIK